MTLKRFATRSKDRRDWYEWWIEDEDTGRELDRGGASTEGEAKKLTKTALATCKQRLLEGPPTELVEVAAMVEVV